MSSELAVDVASEVAGAVVMESEDVASEFAAASVDAGAAAAALAAVGALEVFPAAPAEEQSVNLDFELGLPVNSCEERCFVEDSILDLAACFD